ncbi:hypothetical protein EGR_05600 [Echinococcus granulosus]|uniref:Uncharacterized protein n=1 Tax=Echinococcus granulosus TaxID=6210 RepID=W6UET8_ECHGR|nr:hypothetical protein EGR_05600 [Echinococcus granulosus]EUB59573.1 hypothetical protein EGR_05600 [Echinococcus granulosus]
MGEQAMSQFVCQSLGFGNGFTWSLQHDNFAELPGLRPTPKALILSMAPILQIFTEVSGLLGGNFIKVELKTQRNH